MRRKLIAFAILGLWVVVVAFHVRREYFKSEQLTMLEGAATLAPGTYFYVIRMDERAVGFASSRLDTLPDGFGFEDFLSVDVPALDSIHRAIVRTHARLGPGLELRDFRYELTSEIGSYVVEGVARGDSLLDLTIRSGGQDQRSTLALGPGLTLPVATPLRLAASGRLEVGREYTIPLFDPSVLAPRDVTMRVTDRDTMIVPDTAYFDPDRDEFLPASYDTVPVWRVEESYGSISVASWLDQDGRMVRAESPLGFTLERTDVDLARQEWDRARSDRRYASGYGSIIESTAIASNVDLAAAGGFDSLAVRLLDVELEGFDLEGGRQRLRGDTLFVRRESGAPFRAGYALPYRRGGAPSAELTSTPLIQADHPEIHRLARRIVGPTTDPGEAAERLNAWVYRNLRKDITLSVPSALQVMEALEGDCNEHTVLYVALARSIGLPARTAVGLVHVNGRFYYHAWPEVWLDGWVAVDPTLGQAPADAAHLRFLVGGLARQVELIRLIGRLRLDILNPVTA